MAVGVFERRGNVSEIVACAGALDGEKGTFVAVSVLVLVDVDDSVGAEVDRVGAGGVAAVIFLGVENLGRQGLPAAGRAAVEESRPAVRRGSGTSFRGRGSARR